MDTPILEPDLTDGVGMDTNVIRDYFQKSYSTDVQADALSRILAELVTKEDLARLEARLTWRTVGAMAFLAALTTVLDAFIK